MDKEKQEDQLLSERYHLEEEMADNKREINKFEELVADYQFYQTQEKNLLEEVAYISSDTVAFNDVVSDIDKTEYNDRNVKKVFEEMHDNYLKYQKELGEKHEQVLFEIKKINSLEEE